MDSLCNSVPHLAIMKLSCFRHSLLCSYLLWFLLMGPPIWFPTFNLPLPQSTLPYLCLVIFWKPCFRSHLPSEALTGSKHSSNSWPGAQAPHLILDQLVLRGKQMMTLGWTVLCWCAVSSPRRPCCTPTPLKPSLSGISSMILSVPNSTAQPEVTPVTPGPRRILGCSSRDSSKVGWTQSPAMPLHFNIWLRAAAPDSVRNVIPQCPPSLNESGFWGRCRESSRWF